MRYVVIKNNEVINIIELNNPADYLTEYTLIQSDTAAINDVWDGENFTKPGVTYIPDWSSLKFAFLGNAGYQRITSQTTALLAVTRLEAAVIDYVGGMPSNYSLFKAFWDAIVAGLSQAPSQQEIDSWNAIASNTHMKFSFGADGKMVLS